MKNQVSTPSPSCRYPLLGVFADSRLWKGCFPWIVLLLVAANLASVAFRDDLLRSRAENMLKSARRPPNEGGMKHPRFDVSTGEDLGSYIRYVPDGGSGPVVVVSGMSQMYAINEEKPGDKTISEWMDDFLATDGIRTFGLAAPNLNNEEALLLLLASLSEFPAKPVVFTYGVCFDKFRNVDLRPGYERFLVEHPKVTALWRSIRDEFEDRYPLACAKMAVSPKASEVAGTAPDDLENKLRDVAARTFPLVAERSEINAALQWKAFHFRNWIFRIKPTSKRPIIESRYRLNQEFLGLLDEVARRYGVVLLLYVNPLNPLADNPYVPEQYELFKAWLASFAKERGVPLANLEREVPTEYWGEFLGGPDYKHFKGEGHELTARAILREFRPTIKRAASGCGQ